MGSRTKPTRFILIAGICAGCLVVAPISFSTDVRGRFFSMLETPLFYSSQAAQWLEDLFYFRKNAEENRVYRQLLSKETQDQSQSREIRLENQRLAKLLELKPPAFGAGRFLYARVIARSPLAWNRTFWIDKGFEYGMRENLPVFSGEALIGKIIETRPGASKVILLTDPNCKIGVLIQRTRQQGVLSGTLSGECRVKYISIEAQVKPGDRIETAGLGIFFPKGVPVGDVMRVWKEPGQIYQVAQIKPLADLGKVEEVAILDVR